MKMIEMEQKKELEDIWKRISRLFNRYAARQINWNETTIDNYISRLKQIDFSTPDTMIRSIRKIRVNNADKTYNLTLTALKNLRLAMEKFDEFEVYAEIIVDLEKQRISKPQVENSKPYTDEQRQQLLNYRSGWWHMAFWLAFNTGLRASEIEKLDVDDIDLEEGTILVRESKHGKTRTVVIADVKKIQEYLTIRDIHVRNGEIKGNHFLYNRDGNRAKLTDSGGMFSIFKQEYGYYASLHRARADYITRMIRSGVDIDIVAELVGHESLDTTKGYIDTTLDEMKRQVRKRGLLEE